MTHMELLRTCQTTRFKRVLFLLFISVSLLWGAEVSALTLQVVDPSGHPVSGYRWLVEEDNTYHVEPGVQTADTLAVGVHKSYAPVVTKGHTPSSLAVITMPNGDALPSDKRYVVSVLPDSECTMGGANVAIGQSNVTVIVNLYPVPTAQISVFAFHDMNPINNSPDLFAPLRQDQGLEGFSVIIEDAAGQVTLDAFGNPLGTTYLLYPDGSFATGPDGMPVVDVEGDMVILTDANGEAKIKYIAPGKYGVRILPPEGEGWVQTTTIEGKPVIDAWVGANEPDRLFEFGPALWHIFMGFVKEFDSLDQLPNPLGAMGTLRGRVVYGHMSRPPRSPIYPGVPVPDAWVALNALTTGSGVYAAACEPNSFFTIENIPPGEYQLVTWDKNLDAIIGFRLFTIPATGGVVDMGDVITLPWFGTLEGSIFGDFDEDGFRDPGEPGLPFEEVLLRLVTMPPCGLA